MASKKTIEIVKSTAPVLEVHGEEITTVFYSLLFDKHPELKDVFNMVNQKKGTQQKALTNAVFQYAVHIDKLEMLGDAVETIAQKHVSLSIPKEAYPIVGENLLLAIKQVLGDAATTEIIDAWAEAYEDLAVIFVNREQELYDTKEKTTGGFKGMKEFVVTNKVIENSNIISYHLQRKDGTPVPIFLPGQYIALTIDIPNTTHKHTRNYSLSDSNNKDHLRISVKKEANTPEGIVSNYLHSNINIGDHLSIGMPSGDFVLKNTEKPIVFISGGIGITPLLSMYKKAVDQQKNITFIQCVLNSETQSFFNEIKENANDKVNFATVFSVPLQNDIINKDYDYKGFLTSEILQNLKVSSNSEFYLCGPEPFMAHANKLLKNMNVDSENINYEFFEPSKVLA